MIVHGIPDESIGSCPDGVLAKSSAGAVRHDLRQHEAHRERSERLPQPEADRVAIDGVDRHEQLKRALVWRDEARFQQARERVDDIGRCQLVAVVKTNAAPERCDVFGGLGVVETLREIRDCAQMLVERHEAVVDQLSRFLRHIISRNPRVEVVGRAHDRDDDDVGIGRWAMKAGRGEDSKHAEPHVAAGFSWPVAVRLNCGPSGGFGAPGPSSYVLLQVRQQAQGFERRDAIDVHGLERGPHAVVDGRRRLEQPELLLGLRGRAAQRRPAAPRELVAFEGLAESRARG